MKLTRRLNVYLLAVSGSKDSRCLQALSPPHPSAPLHNPIRIWGDLLGDYTEAPNSGPLITNMLNSTGMKNPFLYEYKTAQPRDTFFIVKFFFSFSYSPWCPRLGQPPAPCVRAREGGFILGPLTSNSFQIGFSVQDVCFKCCPVYFTRRFLVS